MMKIFEQLPQQAYEAIRDRIASILADELRGQYMFTYDSIYLNIPVYIERFKKFDGEEMPCLNVQIWKGETQTEDARGGMSLFSIIVDVYTKAEATETIDGDTLSVKLNQKLMGNCKSILKDARYRTLAFNAPFIGNTKVAIIQFDNPDSTEDKYSTAHGRMIFEVRAADLYGMALARALAGWGTVVKLHETEKGFLYYGEPAPAYTRIFDDSFDESLE
jgi:hypothetical protein